MRRDWDLIRKQLTDIELENDLLKDLPKRPNIDDLEIGEYERECDKYLENENIFCGHLKLLIECGYIDGLSVQSVSNGENVISISEPRLTMQGHDLLDTMRADTIWNKVKQISKEKGVELTFDAIKRFSILALETL